MPDLNFGYLFHSDNWDNDVLDFKAKLSMCIDRRNFIALYAISPDFLHLALCNKIREYPKTVELTPYENEHLEELVRSAMYYIISTTFIADREIKDYLKTLEAHIRQVTSSSQAQAAIKKYPKW